MWFRRRRRAAAAFELLRESLPELSRGLSEHAARVVVDGVTQELRFGAAAVTDRERVLAFAGEGSDHHRAGERPIKPVFDALARDEPRLAPWGIRVSCGRVDCPLGAAVVVPLRSSGGPAGALTVYSTHRRPLAGRDFDFVTGLGDQLSAQLQVSELGGTARAVASAELLALQAQLEPHFVFNCLNTIASFIRTDPEEARRLVLAFADYCRAALASPTELVTLAAELEHVRSYLALERARFGDRLRADVDAEPAALAVNLPRFLVQPLVENAVKHGATARPLHVVVRARIRDGTLQITVRDNGRGIARELIDRVLEPGVGTGNGAGLGLSQVHRRVAALHGGGVKLRSGVFGTVVRLELPSS
jgi:two-component system, LytTR family, sensor histidine kinase LytS